MVDSEFVSSQLNADSFILSWFSNLSFIIYLFIYFNVLFIFERESVRAGQVQREWRTEDPKQALCRQQRAQYGLQPVSREIMTMSQSQMLNGLSHPGAL